MPLSTARYATDLAGIADGERLSRRETPFSAPRSRCRPKPCRQSAGEITAVLPNGRPAEAIVLNRHLLHARDGGGAALLRFTRAHVHDGFQIVQRGRVAAGMNHVRCVAWRFRHHASGKGACPIIEIPIEAFGQVEPLRGIEAERMYGRRHGELDQAGPRSRLRTYRRSIRPRRCQSWNRCCCCRSTKIGRCSVLSCCSAFTTGK